MTTTPPNRDTVILGAGIIGTATAFYLSQSSDLTAANTTVHLVEATPTLFASASGYAGGFLAADWFAPPRAALGALSFGLHRELAERHGGREKWGYSRSTGMSVEEARGLGASGSAGHDWLRQGASRAEVGGKHEFWDVEGPAWLARREGQRVEVVSEGDSTAQVDPKRLCHFLLEQGLEHGVKLHHPAKAISVTKNSEGVLTGIKIERDNGEVFDIPCSRLVLTCGAWTPQVFSTLFPTSQTSIPISQLAGHSLVVRSPRWTAEHEEGGCHAVFATDAGGFSPEIFSRIGSEIYVAGLNDPNLELPKTATDAKPDPKAMEEMKSVARLMLGLRTGEDDLEILREGLCFRPVTRRGPPIVSRVPDKTLGDVTTFGGGDGGVFLSAGHGPWGISQSLGTGKVLAELVQGQIPSVDLAGLGL